jgi:hypothetical protein
MNDPALVAAELRARRDNARSRLDAAIWALLAGEAGEGREQLRRHLAAPDGQGEVAARRTEVAALLGDPERAASEAAAALPDADRSLPGWREYVRAMLAMFAGHDAVAATHVEALGRAIGTRDRLLSGHPAAVTGIARGLLQHDVDLLASGVDALLGWHVERARTKSEVFNSSLGAISLDAIGALLLADRRGLAVPVAPAYRAAHVPLLVVYVNDWNGEPLPRPLELEVATDLIAEPWLEGRGVATGATEG